MAVKTFAVRKTQAAAVAEAEVAAAVQSEEFLDGRGQPDQGDTSVPSPSLPSGAGVHVTSGDCGLRAGTSPLERQQRISSRRREAAVRPSAERPNSCCPAAASVSSSVTNIEGALHCAAGRGAQQQVRSAAAAVSAGLFIANPLDHEVGGQVHDERHDEQHQPDHEQHAVMRYRLARPRPARRRWWP